MLMIFNYYFILKTENVFFIIVKYIFTPDIFFALS